MPNATPEMAEDLRRHWVAQQQQQQAAILQGQALRQNPGMGRGLVIPGGPNARALPIRPNTGTPTPANPAAAVAAAAAAAGGGPVPMRLPPGAPPTTAEQLQAMLNKRNQQIAALQAAGGRMPQTPQQLQQLQARMAMQAAQAAQAAGANPAGANGVPEYIPFIAQQNGVPNQGIFTPIVWLTGGSRSESRRKQQTHATSAKHPPPRPSPATPTWKHPSRTPRPTLPRPPRNSTPTTKPQLPHSSPLPRQPAAESPGDARVRPGPEPGDVVAGRDQGCNGQLSAVVGRESWLAAAAFTGRCGEFEFAETGEYAGSATESESGGYDAASTTEDVIFICWTLRLIWERLGRFWEHVYLSSDFGACVRRLFRVGILGLFV
jgi:hypothetical protein